MKQPMYAGLLLLTAALSSCSKQTINEAAPKDMPVSAATSLATATTITYTDESSFVNSLSSYGFLTGSIELKPHRYYQR